MAQVEEVLASLKGLELFDLLKFVGLSLLHLNLHSISFWMTLRLALPELRIEESADLLPNFAALGFPQVERVHPADCSEPTKGDHQDRSLA